MSCSEILIHHKDILRVHDFFTKKNLEFPCHHFKTIGKYILINYKEKTILLETSNLNKICPKNFVAENKDDKKIVLHTFKTKELQNIDISINNDEIYVFLHEIGRSLKVYNIIKNNFQIKEKMFEKVYLFKTSGEYFIINYQTHLEYRKFDKELVKTTEFIFYDIYKNNFIYLKNIPSKDIEISNNESMLYIYDNSKLKKTFVFKNQFSQVNFTFTDNKSIFILCESTKEYNSYYGTRTLYLYANDSINVIDVPNPIHSICLLKNNKFVIICGYQPAQCIKFSVSFDGQLSKQFLPTGNRNFVFYNNLENRAIYAGINNLPGYFEVYDMENNELIFYIKRVGVSKILWSPCGTYFLLAITNELKVSNGYTIFDYYGREIDDLQVDDLKSIQWIGQGEFKKLKKPEKLKTKHNNPFVFEIPNFPTKTSITKNKVKNTDLPITNKVKKVDNIEFGGQNVTNKSESGNHECIVEDIQIQKDEILKKLETINRLREKVKTENYELTLREMNLCLQEGNLKELLKQLK